MSVSKLICAPAKSITGKSQPEFNMKQLFRVIHLKIRSLNRRNRQVQNEKIVNEK